MNASSLRFDRFELQPRERRLLADGQALLLGARAFDVLVTLVERAGHLVTKAELMDRVWPGLVVEENNIAAQVSALRKVLGGDIIATIPGRGYRFTAVPRAGTEAAAPAPISAVAPAAPWPVTVPGPRMFGRNEDLARTTDVLRQAGCLTLVGTAGVGKTRLAQAVAAHWSGPSVWVDLAALADNTQVVAALARALDVTLPEGDPVPALARALRQDGVLVVLDNAEHVVDAVASLVVLLLRAAGHLRVLVTSQVPLAVPGEQIVRLEPLALPAATLPDAQALQEGAIALLVDRVKAADHRFRAGPDALASLREICSRLDGLPLALEMAAARVPLLGLLGVRDALARRFSLLTTGHRVAPGRHKTLHAALDWSHGLLGEDERRLFRALGVFASGFTLDLAAALAADEATGRWAVIDRLAVLVDRSLVATSQDDPPRYQLLETMRAYALEQLAAAGEEGKIRQRHAHVLLDLFERGAKAPTGSDGQSLRAQSLAELDNAREAMTWALRHEARTAVVLSTDIAMLTTYTAWRGEASTWLAACEPLIDERIEPAVQARWWLELARHLIISANPRAPEVARRAGDLCRALGDELGLFMANVALVRAIREPSVDLDEACVDLRTLLDHHPEWGALLRLRAAGSFAQACERRGDLEGQLAQRLVEVDLARQLGAQDALDAAETNVAWALATLGRYDEAIVRSRAFLDRIGEAETGNAAYAWVYLVTCMVLSGQLAEAQASAPRALAVNRAFDLPLLTDPLALLAARQGRPRAAARLIGHAKQAYASRSMLLEPIACRLLEEAEAIARAVLDEPAFFGLVNEGMALDEAAAERLVFADDDTL